LIVKKRPTHTGNNNNNSGVSVLGQNNNIGTQRYVPIQCSSRSQGCMNNHQEEQQERLANSCSTARCMELGGLVLARDTGVRAPYSFFASSFPFQKRPKMMCAVASTTINGQPSMSPMTRCSTIATSKKRPQNGCIACAWPVRMPPKT